MPGPFVFTTGVLAPNFPVSITSLIPVILMGRLGTTTPIVNTKWLWHLSILPWIPGSPFTIHTCMCAESCPKECFYKPFKRTRHD